MAVVSKNDFMERIKTIVGEDTSDSAMSFIEDMTDTYNDLESRAGNSNSDEWQKKYDALDAEWRAKYKARFFDGVGTTPEEVKKEQTDDVKDDGEVVDFDDLFKEREGN